MGMDAATATQATNGHDDGGFLGKLFGKKAFVDPNAPVVQFDGKVYTTDAGGKVQFFNDLAKAVKTQSMITLPDGSMIPVNSPAGQSEMIKAQLHMNYPTLSEGELTKITNQAMSKVGGDFKIVGDNGDT